MPDKKYHIRYLVEKWDKPLDGEVMAKMDGIKVMKGPYGYTDHLFLISMINEGTWLILDTRNEQCPTEPTREMLEEVRDFINHCLEHHV